MRSPQSFFAKAQEHRQAVGGRVNVVMFSLAPWLQPGAATAFGVGNRLNGFGFARLSLAPISAGAWAKVLMVLQSIISLTVPVLLAARAVPPVQSA